MPKKSNTFQYNFELYILSEELTADHWNSVYKALAAYLGVFGVFELTFSVADNVVRFFLSCDKDLGSLSDNIEGVLLRPVGRVDIAIPETLTKDRFIQFVTDGNLLSLKEKTLIKKSKNLQAAKFKVKILGDSKSYVKTRLYFKNPGGGWSYATKVSGFFPAKLFAINFGNSSKYLKKATPKYLSIEKSLHMLRSSGEGALFEIDTFPYLPYNYYLSLTSYEFDKHSFIVGASGSGKSKLISLFIDRLAKTNLKMDYHVVVIDPHAAILHDLDHVPSSKVINFGRQDSTDLFPGANTDLTAATELTSTLFKSLLADQFNPRLDRLLRFSFFILMTAQTMSLENLRRFLVDVDYRNQILKHVEGYVPQNITKFFGADYNELRTQFYNETILPIVSLVEEMQMQPSLVGENEQSLAKTIDENFLTVFSLNKVSMGQKTVKTVAGLLIQQIFLLAQAAVFGRKIILIIDEVSVIQNPAIAQILAEARKFNLTVILSQQYFGQVDKELQDAIFANVFNYYVFKVSEEDARALEGNLNMDLPKEVADKEKDKGTGETEVKIKLLTELHPRECMIRVVSNGQIAPCIKGRTVEAPHVTAEASQQKKDLKQVLPEKFIEGAEVPKKQIEFSPEFLKQIGKNAAENTDVIYTSIPAKRSISSLRELLTSQSSSRANLRKKKE